MEQNRFFRSTVFGLAIAALALFWLQASPAQARYAAIVIDADNGRVLHAVNPDTQKYPASLTKMMTLYLVFEALESGRLKLDTPLSVSRRAEGMSPSKLDLKSGDTISVESVILALVTKSANDAAVVAAEELGGTEIEFAKAMTAKARELGMRNTTFRNASGLPNQGQLSTARDMAKLAGRLIKDFPKYYAYFSRDQYSFRGQEYKNHNNLLRSYEGTDGVKTGYIRASGFNLAASVTRDNHRLIGVVFGGKTAKSRDKQMTALLEREFKKLATQDQELAESNKFADLSRKKLNRPIDEAPARIALRPVPAAPVAEARPVVAEASVSPAPVAAELAKPQTISAPSNAWAQDDTEWAIQVGAYGDIAPARAAAQKAVSRIPELTERTHISIAPYRTGDHIMYRARLIGMSGDSAKLACKQLERRQIPCIAIAPDRVRQPQASDNNQTATRQP